MEVLTTAEMSTADQLAISGGTSGFTLMRNAGRAVAEAAIDLVEDGPILVVAGTGNNGGDGFVAASELAARGRDVAVMLLGERTALEGDAALAAQNWTGPVLPGNPVALGTPALIVEQAGEGWAPRPDRGDQCQWRAGVKRRSAERHQRQ